MSNNLSLSPEERSLLKKQLNEECDYNMPEDVIDKFLDLGQVKYAEKKEYFIQSGDKISDIFLAINGIVRCWYYDNDSEKTALFSTVPTLFMDYHSYYADIPAFYNYQAITRVKYLRIRRRDFDYYLSKSPEFAMWNLRVLQNQMYYFELKHKLNTGSALDRYRSLIKTLPNIMREVPLGIVASYLGITPQYLSRLRREV